MYSSSSFVRFLNRYDNSKNQSGALYDWVASFEDGTYIVGGVRDEANRNIDEYAFMAMDMIGRP